MITIVEYGEPKGGVIINLAGGKRLISFAIDKGSSQQIPNKKPSQNKYQ
jgi:hypothetical protein